MTEKRKTDIALALSLMAAMFSLGASISICCGMRTEIREATETVEQIHEEVRRIEREHVVIAPQPEIPEYSQVEPVIKMESLGLFTLTAYCPCEKCCGEWAKNRPTDGNGEPIVYGSIGIQLEEGVSVAVDPDVIPYGSEIVIDGHAYKAQDCGGAIQENRIDVFFSDHQRALEFAVQQEEVFIVL